MIRLKAFLVSIILVVVSLIVIDRVYIKKIENYYKVKDNSVRYNTSYEKYKSRDIITKNITNNTTVLLGSSELTTTINESYHPKKIFNYKDFNIMQIGVGHSQNIIHAATLGSIGDNIKNNQVVMVQSIQWFDNKNGILKGAFLSRISEEHVYNTMNNSRISKSTKEKFINRVIELSSENKEMHKKFKNYKKYFLEEKGNVISKQFMKFDNYIYSLKNKYQFYKNKSIENYPTSGDSTPNYNWNELKEKFTKEAQKKTDNNTYGIDNLYYDKYIKSQYDKLKNISKNTKYDDSPEYKDLDIFLSIAKDLGIKLKFAIFPANGKWSDYTGIDKHKREVAYNKLKKIAKENNVDVLDYTGKEYENYYLCDTMHLGWRGWLDFERDLYKLAKEN
ncbi:D-alanyl-lipoteichoic acid biosynthesis protein DltD [Gemella cuniculi]|uniref:D-alanyl-lipoteichoic acid biosynthesis protein DltD n=1 Tax=Gemella cuniculi TaxID=150240 RepID=UPI00041B13F6|nr:D-alanyl-lipoteichoic acid biosynthesis protein DltD [Gemella cuniculi]